MAEKKTEEKKGQEAQSGVEGAIRTGNQVTDKAITDALAEIEKEKDDKKKRIAKKQLCVATYVNRKTLLQLQQRRREDEITKEKLNATKSLLERLLGVECEIKDGECIPTKKKIDAKLVLTPTEHESETRKMEEEFSKKVQESDKQYDQAMKELRNSYEGEYRHYVEGYWY
jgi:hypothetical protein